MYYLIYALVLFTHTRTCIEKMNFNEKNCSLTNTDNLMQCLTLLILSFWVTPNSFFVNYKNVKRLAKCIYVHV